MSEGGHTATDERGGALHGSSVGAWRRRAQAVLPGARLERLARRLERGLRVAAAEVPEAAVSLARVGSLLTVFFRHPTPRDLTEAEDPDAMAFARFHAALWSRGVLIPPSRYEAWSVSAAHSDEDIDLVVAAAHEAFIAAAGIAAG